MKELMMTKNEDGKIVEKKVPENLVSNYEKAGWTIKETSTKNKTSFSSKTESNSDNN